MDRVVLLSGLLLIFKSGNFNSHEGDVIKHLDNSDLFEQIQQDNIAFNGEYVVGESYYLLVLKIMEAVHRGFLITLHDIKTDGAGISTDLYEVNSYNQKLRLPALSHVANAQRFFQPKTVDGDENSSYDRHALQSLHREYTVNRASDEFIRWQRNRIGGYNGVQTNRNEDAGSEFPTTFSPLARRISINTQSTDYISAVRRMLEDERDALPSPGDERRAKNPVTGDQRTELTPSINTASTMFINEQKREMVREKKSADHSKMGGERTADYSYDSDVGCLGRMFNSFKGCEVNSYNQKLQLPALSYVPNAQRSFQPKTVDGDENSSYDRHALQSLHRENTVNRASDEFIRSQRNRIGGYNGVQPNRNEDAGSDFPTTYSPPARRLSINTQSTDYISTVRRMLEDKRDALPRPGDERRAKNPVTGDQRTELTPSIITASTMFINEQKRKMVTEKKTADHSKMVRERTADCSDDSDVGCRGQMFNYFKRRG